MKMSDEQNAWHDAALRASGHETMFAWINISSQTPAKNPGAPLPPGPASPEK